MLGKLTNHAHFGFSANKINVVIRKRELKSDLASFLHGALFSPVTSTLTKAIDNNHFISWPGLTTKLIKKHLLLIDCG